MFDSFLLFWDVPIRMALGAIFIAHGCRKLFGWFGGRDYQETPKLLEQLGAKPAHLLMVMAGVAQLLGALLVLFGFWTRIGATLLFAEVLIGIPLAHLEHGFFLNWRDEPGKGNGIEYNVAIMGLALSLILAGAGPWSLDAFIRGIR
jgi:putative oxidoreductase